MSKSVLYATNASTQTVAANGVINFGSVSRRFGCNTNLVGGNAVVNGGGYFEIEANVTVAPTAAGLVTVALYKDGSQIPGAEATISATAGDTYALTIPAVIRSCCPCEQTITAVISAAGTISNAAIIVEKM